MMPANHGARIEERIDALELELRSLRRSTGRGPAPRIAVRRTSRLRRALITVGVTLAVVALPASIAASHQFTDVPDSNTFHGQISDVADAAITAGCDTNLYCPGASVTRGQMAAFLHRGLGRVAVSSGFHSTVSETSGTYDIETVTIKAGDVTGGQGYILVQGTASMTTQSATPCPCNINIVIVLDGTESEIDAWETIEDIGGPLTSGTWRFGNASINDVFLVSTGVTHTVELRVKVYRTASSSVGLETSLTAMYVPFNGNGDVAALAAIKGTGADDPAK